MLKKYTVYLMFAVAALLLLWIKLNQRGKKYAHDKIQVEAKAPEPFERNIALLNYSKHAQCRMGCRHIDKEEVEDILQNGKFNYQRTEEDEKGVTYAMEGITKDNQMVRIVFAPHSDKITVVTVIDLDTDWPCSCN
ncbi:MAG: DUF4258 domain-containing protein [Ferruginibacter sp.]|mgnify:CR=1 FL=1|nr:DUF4258 domain-containing protein [Ferruginibacter sp.]